MLVALEGFKRLDVLPLNEDPQMGTSRRPSVRHFCRMHLAPFADGLKVGLLRRVSYRPGHSNVPHLQVSLVVDRRQEHHTLSVDQDVEVDAIKQYRILMCAVCSPDRFGRRGYNIVVTNSEKDSDSWRLSLVPTTAEKGSKPKNPGCCSSFSRAVHAGRNE